MERILVGIDGKEENDKVVDFAVELAKSSGASLILAYSITDKSVPAAIAEEYRDEKGYLDEERYYKDLFERAAADAERKLAKTKVPFEGIWGYGDPSKFLLSLAKSHKANVIVVGIHGLRGFGKVKALREVARNVIERSQVPVVAVP